MISIEKKRVHMKEMISWKKKREKARIIKELEKISKFKRAYLGWPLGWVEPELGRSTLGLGRVECTSSVREGWTGSGSCPSGLDGCPTGWIGQTYLSVGHSTRISAHTKSSGWEINRRVDHQILSDGLIWVVRFCPSPSPGLARVPWP
jgi:hypothetical protein